MKARILLVGALLFTLTCEVLASSQRHVVVNRTADSGPGTLREALTIAVSGDLIVFNPDVFPPTSPVTIPLTSALPVINQGNLAIDASNAGVILDGSGIGTTPETMLLDDVSLTLDGGPNLIINGDFTAGLGHWRPWDEAPGATRSITTTDFKSPPNAYEWTTVVHAGDSRTVYDTTDTSEPFDDWPYYDGSTVWIPATGNAVEVRFWYRSGVGVRLWAVFPDGVGLFAGDQNFPWEADWTEGVFSRELPPDAVGVALELYYRHPQGWTCGLPIESNGNTVQGLQIVNFPNHGIALRDAQSNTIGGNREVGIGPLGQGNLVSGNGECGVDLWGGGTSFNTIMGNYIGTDLSGTAAWANHQDGVHLYDANNNQVIGNLISGNDRDGVSIAGVGAFNNTVSGNYIGTDVYGTAAIGNLNGVKIAYGAKNNTIGGDMPGEGNVISGNVENGVLIEGSDSTGNTISHNSITANGGAGIENVNGGNTELASPVITDTVGMTVSGTACADCTLEFFSDDEDEGRVFEGSTTAESDGTFTFSRIESFTSPNVTATATDADGNTSEFSAPVSVPVLIIEPDVGTYDTFFNTTGSGWVPGEVVTVESFWPDGSPIISRDYTADANGDIDPYNWIAGVGEPAGIYTWTATGPTSGSVTKTFEVLPATEPLLAVYPDSGVVGETFYIGGSGFQSSENITLTFTGPTTVTLNVTADEEGNFYYIEWDSTGYLWGTYTVEAVGDQGSTANATFEVLPIRIYLPIVTKNYQ